MRVIARLLVGMILVWEVHTAAATSLQALVLAAGLSAPAKPVAAADFQLPDATGRQLQLQDQRGAVVFINFWATWCLPCRHEMPMMEQLYQTFRAQPFVLWAVNLQESREDATRFMQEQQLHFPALLDLNGALSYRYNVRGLPTTFLIDCAGMLVGHAVGPRQWDSDATRTLLAALLDDKSCRR
jgi:peroxiredoxin